ncbi:protein translocase subunit SecA [Striga asiatica]|uniref:Protein translocase subunit SecA n=1 Tax=Striga asiatica TaxID=4170 RepID=A0A5A7NYE0_STRAF|nr:protein translocase subunit SecA [Striga asiatica]
MATFHSVTGLICRDAGALVCRRLCLRRAAGFLLPTSAIQRWLRKCVMFLFDSAWLLICGELAISEKINFHHFLTAFAHSFPNRIRQPWLETDQDQSLQRRRSTPTKHQGRVGRERRRRLASAQLQTDEQLEPAISGPPENCRTPQHCLAARAPGRGNSITGGTDSSPDNPQQLRCRKGPRGTKPQPEKRCAEKK